MNRSEALAFRIREVYINGKWIANTNYKEQIAELSLQQATQKVQNLNSIAALTFHINYYLNGLLQFFDSAKLVISDQLSFNMPILNDENDWQNLCKSLLNNAKLFADKIEQLDESLLNETFVEEKYGTYLRNIEGLLEHSYYHLGQIVLIKKMIQFNGM